MPGSTLAKYAGLAEGDAHVVRNAGGRATDDAIRSVVISHKLLGTGGSTEGRFVKWHTIADRERAVIEDVTRIRRHPLVNPSIPIAGFVYDVKTGRMNEVPAATAAGSTRA